MLKAFAMSIPTTPPNQGEYLKLPKYYAPLLHKHPLTCNPKLVGG